MIAQKANLMFERHNPSMRNSIPAFEPLLPSANIAARYQLSSFDTNFQWFTSKEVPSEATS